MLEIEIPNRIIPTMSPKKSEPSPEQKAKILAELRRDVGQHNKSYRSRALALFPHVCASCGREFEGHRLKELTVHHKDHNHDNNPADGSNWELLCLYCHDHEHQKAMDAQYIDSSRNTGPSEASRIADPFSALDQLLDKTDS